MNLTGPENHYLDLARCLTAERKFHAAHEVLIKVLENDPSNPVLLYNLGETAFLGELFGVAEIHFQMAAQALENTGEIVPPTGQIVPTPRMITEKIAICRSDANSETSPPDTATQEKLAAIEVRTPEQ